MAELSCELGYPATGETMALRVRAVLASSADLVVVATEGDSSLPLGWLQAHAANLVESGFRVEILGLVVSAAARRAGIGRALVSEAERWAVRIGSAVIVVRSNVHREASHAFYSALGYTAAKRQIVYRKTLPDE
jgi:GNAT superfamily N-acetyltransferase